ncbi:MAG: hypothetical protein GY865_05590 [candidate division Zixibacteria bacterium]|nr:hypothetical protein [candidate division Zixibacteria bacterium]
MKGKIVVDSSQNTPQISAFAGDMNFMVSYFKAGGPVLHSNDEGDSILHAAAEGWQFQMVQFLILSGADVNARNNNGETPLHIIIRSNDAPFEGKFLRHTTPENARKETFRILLCNGADTSIQDNRGGNALHVAASEGDVIGIDELAIGGRIKLIDAVTSKGATALVLAIFQEHAECIKRLIAYGADVNYELRDDVTPLTLLHSSKNPELKAIYKATINK